MISTETLSKANQYVNLVRNKKTNQGWSILFFYLSIFGFASPILLLYIILKVVIPNFIKYGFKSDMVIALLITIAVIYLLSFISLIVSDIYDRAVKKTPYATKLSIPGWSQDKGRSEYYIFTFFTKIKGLKEEIDESIPPSGGLAVTKSEFDQKSKNKFTLTRRPVTIHGTIKNLPFMKDDATICDLPVKIQMQYDIEIKFIGDVLPLSFYCNYGYSDESLALFKEMVHKNVNHNIVLPRFDILFKKTREEMSSDKNRTKDKLIISITEITFKRMRDECRGKTFSISCINGKTETKIDIELKNIRPEIKSIVKAPAS